MKENMNAEIGAELNRVAAFTEDHLYAVSQRSGLPFATLAFELGGLLYALARRRSLGDTEPTALSDMRSLTSQGAFRVPAPALGARMRGNAPKPPGYWKAVIVGILARTSQPTSIETLRGLLRTQQHLSRMGAAGVVGNALRQKDNYLYQERNGSVSLASNVDVAAAADFLEKIQDRILPPSKGILSDAARKKMSIAKKAWWAAKKAKP